MNFTKFLKNRWVTIKSFFSCLISVALFPSYAVILENISDALGIKSLILRVHLAMRRSSENIDPQKIVDGMLLLEILGIVRWLKGEHRTLWTKVPNLY